MQSIFLTSSEEEVHGANWSFVPCGFYCRKQRIMLWPVHLDLLPSSFYLLATWSYWCLHSLLRISPHLNCICEEGNGNPLQCSCLENPRDGRASWAVVYEVTQSWTWLKRLSSNSSSKLHLSWQTYLYHWDLLGQWFSNLTTCWGQLQSFKHSHVLLGEGNGTPLQYSCLENPMVGGAWWAAVHGVAKCWTRLSDFTCTFTFMHWRRKWQPTPVFLPGESQGRWSLVRYRLWGCTESDKQLSSSMCYLKMAS